MRHCRHAVAFAAVALLIAAPQAHAVNFAPAPGSPFPAAEGATDVVAGDLDNDGDQDLATANFWDESVTVLLGNGSGGFSAAPGSPVPTGGRSEALAVGHLNADGNRDLVVANGLQGTVTVLLGDGAGGFAEAADSPELLPFGANPVDIEIADFNNDGKADFVTANGGEYVSVMLGDGSGDFFLGAGTPDDSVSRPLALTVAELDGDVNLDVAVLKEAGAGSSDPGVAILLGDGGGGFAAAPDFEPGETNPRALDSGDLDGDDDSDLVVVKRNNSAGVVALNDGSGGFAHAPGSPFFLHDPAAPDGLFPEQVAVGDVTGEGDADFVTANAELYDASAFVGDGTGRFTRASGSPFDLGGVYPTGLVLAHLDGDGRLDIATVHHRAATENPAYQGTVTVLLNAPPDTTIASGPSGASVQASGATFGFGSPDVSSTFECRLDGGAWTPCSSPKSYAKLTAGSHTFEVRATNDAGKTDPTPAARTWTVVGPSTSIDGGPSGSTRRTSATFAFSSPSADAAGFQCRLDGGGFEACSSGRTYTGLGEGAHVFTVRAVDDAGNVDPSPPSRSWTVDRSTPPDAALSAAPNPVLTGDEVRFDASASRDPLDGSLVGHRWDLDGDGSFETDTGSTPTATQRYSDRGIVDVRVRVTNDAGVADTASTALDVRLSPPRRPVGVSIDNGARFTNSRRVTIVPAWPLFATGMLVSNDGGFGDAGPVPVDFAVPWTLDAGGSEQIPRTVYVRFLGGESGPETYQDDIVLDRTRPRIRSARLVGAPRGTGPRTFKIKLSAADAVSGLRYAQTAALKANPDQPVRFSRTLRVRRSSAPRWVRVQDRAGNFSLWHRLARPR